MSTGIEIKSGYLAHNFRVSLFLLFFSIVCQIAFGQLINKSDREFLSNDFLGSYHPTAEKIIEENEILAAFYKSEQSNNLEKRYEALKINHPPGYPIFVALNYKIADILQFERIPFLKFVETIVYGLSAITLFFVFKLFFSNHDSIFGTILWIINPLNLWLTRNPHSEIPFFLFFFLSLFFFFQMRSERNNLYLVLFSLCVAITIFIRSAAIYLPLVCLLVTISSLSFNKTETFTIKQRIGICFIPYLLIAPWITFISIEHKAFVPIANSGQKMIYNGLTYLKKKGDDEFIEASIQIKDLITQIEKSVDALTPGEEANSKQLVIIKNLIHDPYTTMKIITLKLVKSTHATWSKRDEHKIFWFNLIFFILAAYGLLLNQKNKYLQLAIVFLIYSFAICIVTAPIVRYMVPALGLFSVYVAISLRRLFLITTTLPLSHD